MPKTKINKMLQQSLRRLLHDETITAFTAVTYDDRDGSLCVSCVGKFESVAEIRLYRIGGTDQRWVASIKAMYANNRPDIERITELEPGLWPTTVLDSFYEELRLMSEVT